MENQKSSNSSERIHTWIALLSLLAIWYLARWYFDIDVAFLAER